MAFMGQANAMAGSGAVRPRREDADSASGSRHIDDSAIVDVTLTGYDR
jgi:hypothetical protein